MLLKAHISLPVLASEAVMTGQTLISQIGEEFWRDTPLEGLNPACATLFQSGRIGTAARTTIIHSGAF